MIAKGKSISHLSNAINYALNKAEAVVLDKNIASEKPFEVENEFGMSQKFNSRCQKNTLSIVISPTIEDGKKLSNEDLVKINKSFLEKMNLGNLQYIAFLHNDQKHKHIHLYVNRIDYQGKAYDDKFLSNRCAQVAEVIAKEKNLTTAKEIKRDHSQKKGYIKDLHSNSTSENFIRNREALIKNPSIILSELTGKSATFNQADLLKEIKKRIGDDDTVVSNVFGSVLKDAVSVGEGIDGKTRYTTQDYKSLELEALDKTATLLGTPFEQSQLIKSSSKEYCETHFKHLSQEQKDAVLGLTTNQSLAVLIGRAGAGKTTTLKAVSDFYKDSGFKVIGTSFSAIAAENLGKEAGIKTATLHSWSYKWDRYQAVSESLKSFDGVMEEGKIKQLDWYKDLKSFESSKLTKDTVLIVDEAGMVGTRQWNEVLTHVQRSGAKLIAVGDDNQFKAIEAGDLFREIKNQASQIKQGQNQMGNMSHLVKLESIRRQQHDWMKDASKQLAELNISEGLSTYEKNGHVHQTSKANLVDKASSSYLQKIQSDPSQKGLVLAFTNAEVSLINQKIREGLKQSGSIGKEDLVKINGKEFSIGDRVVFLKNDKTQLAINDANGVVQNNLSIKNGTQGKIHNIDIQGNVKIQLDDNYYTTIKANNAVQKAEIGQVEPKSIRTYNYTHISHGYAVTTHKAQGQTVDFSIVVGSKHMDAKGLYVAMTRHRNDVQLLYGKKDFNSFKALTNKLSHFKSKDLVKDYTIRPENEPPLKRVQEYRMSVLDASAAAKTNDWKGYQEIKEKQTSIGKEILSDFNKHQLYVYQAGLTKEKLEIATGEKARPLSRIEEQAKMRVKMYGEWAELAKSVLDDIKKTHPGSKFQSHPNYSQLNEIRNERNALAKTISENYSLHREFVKEASHVYGINHKTIASQSRQGLEIKEESKKVGYDAKMTNSPNRAEGISKGMSYSNFKEIQNNNTQEKKFEQILKDKIRSLASEVMSQRDVKDVKKFVDRFNEKGAEKGLKCDAYHNQQGKFQGLRFYGGEQKFKASEIDKSLSKNYIEKELEGKNHYVSHGKIQKLNWGQD